MHVGSITCMQSRFDNESPRLKTIYDEIVNSAVFSKCIWLNNLSHAVQTGLSGKLYLRTICYMHFTAYLFCRSYKYTNIDDVHAHV